MQTMVLFRERTSLYHEIYDLADSFWLKNTLVCSQDECYLKQLWSVVSPLLSRESYNEEEIVFTAGINWFEYDLVGRPPISRNLLLM